VRLAKGAVLTVVFHKAVFTQADITLNPKPFHKAVFTQADITLNPKP
jgi:hypothetical protein